MTGRCAVLGDPIGHSLSPVLHRAGYAELGLDWTYDAYQVGAEGLPAFLADLDSTWRGLSLTMPLKHAAMRATGHHTTRADLAGVANTLVIEAGVPVLADNTDLPGAVAAIRERYDGPVTAGTVLGGGATAASTGLALCELGATEVTLLVRSPERAALAAAALARHASGPRVVVGSLLEDPVVGEVVVSTIPATAQDPGLVERCLGVDVLLDVVYDPWPTPLVRALGEGRDSGSSGSRVVVGGLDLLAHQAALQFELFTGHEAPLDRMREAAILALAERHA